MQEFGNDKSEKICVLYEGDFVMNGKFYFTLILIIALTTLLTSCSSMGSKDDKPNSDKKAILTIVDQNQIILLL